MTRLNNRLDKVLEKLAEYEDVAETKVKATQLIEAEDYEGAMTLVKALAKGAEKLANLNSEETELRTQLEELRVKSEAIAGGDVSIELSGNEEPASVVTSIHKPDANRDDDNSTGFNSALSAS